MRSELHWRSHPTIRQSVGQINSMRMFQIQWAALRSADLDGGISSICGRLGAAKSKKTDGTDLHSASTPKNRKEAYTSLTLFCDESMPTSACRQRLRAAEGLECIFVSSQAPGRIAP